MIDFGIGQNVEKKNGKKKKNKWKWKNWPFDTYKNSRYFFGDYLYFLCFFKWNKFLKIEKFLKKYLILYVFLNEIKF